MNLIDPFKNYIYLMKRFKKYTSLAFGKNAHYLKPGKYKYDFNYTYYYHKDCNKVEYPLELFLKNRKIQDHFILKDLTVKLSYYLIAFFTVKKVRNRQLNFPNYQAELIFNKRGAGFKFFDNKNSKVITIFSELDALNSMREINHIHKYFCTAITKIDNSAQVVIEDLLDESQENLYDVNNLLSASRKILEDFSVYLGDFTSLPSYTVNTKFLLSKYHSILSVIPPCQYDKLITLDINIPLISFFTDIKKQNVFLIFDEYKLIDFDGFREISPLTVAFGFLNSLFSKTSLDYLYYYKKGDFDLNLNKLFNEMGLDFDSKLKDSYFIFSMITDLFIRQNILIEPTLTSTKLDSIIANFHNTLNRYNSIKVS